jgi:hypothetical protein
VTLAPIENFPVSTEVRALRVLEDNNWLNRKVAIAQIFV